jgi:hypothetical protein
MPTNDCRTRHESNPSALRLGNGAVNYRALATAMHEAAISVSDLSTSNHLLRTASVLFSLAGKDGQAAEPRDERRLIGYLGVDSGQMMVGDPCYVLPSDDDAGTDYMDMIAERARLEAAVKHQTGGARQFTPFDYQGAGTDRKALKFLVTNTGWGDGEYPVYLTFNPFGEVSRLEVVFEEEEDGPAQED